MFEREIKMSPPVSGQRSAELARKLWDALKTRDDLTREAAVKHLRCSLEELDEAIEVLSEAMEYAEKKVADYQDSPVQHQPSKEMRDLFAFA